MMKYLWLVPAVLFIVGGVLLGRVARLSPIVTATIAGVPAFLVLFPLVREGNSKLRFGHWLFAAAVAIATSWLIYWAFS